MKIAIVGSRTFCDYEMLKNSIDKTCSEQAITIDAIISGGARGADTLGERYADERGYDKIIYPAEWSKYGKRAGFIRNETIIEQCDVCFAFWDGVSHGTRHDIELCQKKNRPCFIFRF